MVLAGPKASSFWSKLIQECGPRSALAPVVSIKYDQPGYRDFVEEVDYKVLI